jgi:hypothetical protein
MNDSDETLYDYSVIFYMEGIDRSFVYEVSKAIHESIRQSLEDDDIGNILFEAYRPVEQIVVNSRFIQVARFLWRPKEEAGGSFHYGESDETASERPKRVDTVDLYFTGREAPVRLRAGDPEEVFDFLLAMETEAFPRCSMVDAQGEEAVIDLRKLVCAELPLGLAQRGEAHALAELEEEA